MDKEIFEEFVQDSTELLDITEDCFCKLSKGESVNEHYDKIYRCLHSIKGASGMFDLINVANATHRAEDLLQIIKSKGTIDQKQIDYFMKFIDTARDHISRNDKSSTIDLPLPSTTLAPPPSKSPTPAILTLAINDKSEEQIQKAPKDDSFLFDIDQLKEELKSNYKPIILIVDDEVSVHKLVKKMITTDSLIISAINVSQASAILKLCHPHLVITDIKMPGESGIDLLKILSKNFSNIPVVMISGNPSAQTTIEALNNGALYFLEKPFSKADLQTVTKKGLMKRMKNYIAEMKINTI